MKLRHPGFAYDAHRTESVIEKPCYLYTTFVPRRRGSVMLSASAHPFELPLVESIVGEFDTGESVAVSHSQVLLQETGTSTGNFIIAGTVDFLRDEVLKHTCDDEETSAVEGDVGFFDTWVRLGFSAVFEIQAEHAYEAVLQGRLFRITAARLLEELHQAWTVIIEELEGTGYWYRFTFASETALHGNSAEAIKTGATMIAAHLRCTEIPAIA